MNLHRLAIRSSLSQRKARDGVCAVVLNTASCFVVIQKGAGSVAAWTDREDECHVVKFLHRKVLLRLRNVHASFGSRVWFSSQGREGRHHQTDPEQDKGGHNNVMRTHNDFFDENCPLARCGRSSSLNFRRKGRCRAGALVMCDDSQPVTVAASSEPMMSSTLQVMATCPRVGHRPHCHQRGRTIFVRKHQNALPALRKASARKSCAPCALWRQALHPHGCACAAVSASATDGSMFGSARLRLFRLFRMKLIDLRPSSLDGERSCFGDAPDASVTGGASRGAPSGEKPKHPGLPST